MEGISLLSVPSNNSGARGLTPSTSQLLVGGEGFLLLIEELDVGSFPL